ncbi:AAA family ATPase [soil metagenome]
MAIQNSRLAQGDIDQPGQFPRLDNLRHNPFIFNMDFGLPELPREPGILLIRGARQYGKSTWLEQTLYQTIKQFGPGSGYYLNGENIADHRSLETEIASLVDVFNSTSLVKRIFIDEITAIPHWEMALKRLADNGKLTQTLLITTGSKATDLRRGAERLPGRKGKLSRTTYLFTPVSYAEFRRVCGSVLGEKTLPAYLLSGGSPIACSALAAEGIIPDYVIELTRDWIEGEIAISGRTRAAFFNIMSGLFRFGGTPLGQAKLAREAALANNTVAAGYIELLNDLGCVVPAYPWDPNRKILILRKPCKYHMSNLLAAVAYHPAELRSVEDFQNLSAPEQGAWHEWLVAQELLRRRAIKGDEILTPLAFWQSSNHELDFVESAEHLIEVKRGHCSAIEFRWFPQQFPHKLLTVINASHFVTDFVKGMTMEDFLLGFDS